jgi:hypothetical protein
MPFQDIPRLAGPAFGIALGGLKAANSLINKAWTISALRSERSPQPAAAMTCIAICGVDAEGNHREAISFSPPPNTRIFCSFVASYTTPILSETS